MIELLGEADCMGCVEVDETELDHVRSPALVMAARLRDAWSVLLWESGVGTGGFSKTLRLTYLCVMLRQAA